MKKIVLALLAATVVSGCAKEPRATADLSRHGPDSVAIDGYSPVSYFLKSRAEKGSPEFAVAYDGLSYWLTDASQAEVFGADPEKYVPAHRGWCSLMLTGSGNFAVANPESFKIVDDRLLLFWSGDFKGQAINGLSNWESKFEDEAGERALLARADKAWSKLLSGRKSEHVVFFGPGDEARVNDARRAAGERMYE